MRARASLSGDAIAYEPGPLYSIDAARGEGDSAGAKPAFYRRMHAAFQGQTSARMRAGPPVPPLCLGAPITSVAPLAGTLSRLAMFSMPNRPEGSQA